jgi:hypothetical protein
MLDFLTIYSKGFTSLSNNVLEMFMEKLIYECSFNYRDAYYFLSKEKAGFALFVQIIRNLILVVQKMIKI